MLRALLLASCLAAPFMARAAEPPADLSFDQLYRRPVGPLGLEPSAKLLSLDGKQVRIEGFMARSDPPPPGSFILAPIPVTLDNEDEPLADDLPPAAIFVHLPADLAATPAPFAPGRIAVTGTLHVGAAREGDGRVSYVRITLDSPPAPSISTTKEKNP